MDTKQRVVQNTGVLDPTDDETEIINGETVSPGTYGRTEGGVPAGTPPSAPPAGAEAPGEQLNNREETER